MIHRPNHALRPGWSILYWNRKCNILILVTYFDKAFQVLGHRSNRQFRNSLHRRFMVGGVDCFELQRQMWSLLLLWR